MAVLSLDGAARIAAASAYGDLAAAIRATDRPGHSTKPAEGDPGSVVEVDDVGGTEVVGGVVVGGLVLVVAVGLQTAGLASQSACTSREQDFRQRARCLPLSPEHSASMQAAISSRHAFLPQTGGFARAGNARSSIASIAAPTDIVNERVVMRPPSWATGGHSSGLTSNCQPARSVNRACNNGGLLASQRLGRNRRSKTPRGGSFLIGHDRSIAVPPAHAASSDPRYSTTQVSPLCRSARRSPFDFFLAAATCAPSTSS